ncbi:hypothetical protein HK100_010411, partial [Physocladia obscura]
MPSRANNNLQTPPMSPECDSQYYNKHSTSRYCANPIMAIANLLDDTVSSEINQCSYRNSCNQQERQQELLVANLIAANKIANEKIRYQSQLHYHRPQSISTSPSPRLSA